MHSVHTIRFSLTHNAKVYRSKANDISHDGLCVFVHFLRGSERHTTEAQFQDLAHRLSKGYLDSELHEKAKTMDAKPTVLDFCFIPMVTGKQVVNVQGPTSLEQQSQECEIAVFFEKPRPRLCCVRSTGVRHNSRSPRPVWRSVLMTRSMRQRS